MADEGTFTKQFRESLENKRIGGNFLGIRCRNIVGFISITYFLSR